MANRFARKSGNWNASDVWSDTPTGTASASFIPTTGDVAMSNSFAITVNVDATCAEVRNDTTGGATAGGYFDLSAGVTLTANAYAGSTTGQCIRVNLTAPNVAYFAGSITGGTGSTSYGAQNTNNGTFSITGLVNGGSGNNAYGVNNSSTGTITINTSGITGGTNTDCRGVNNASSGTITITGNVTGGTAGGCHGAYNASTGTISVTGSATGGPASNVFGAINFGAGTLSVSTAIGNAFGNGSVGLGASPGVSGSSTGLTTVKSIQYGSRGQSPTAGCIFIEPDDNNQAVFVKSDLSTLTLARLDVAGLGYAQESDVRYGVSYALGNLTGTCHVPTASQVSAGVAVDNTTGTAVLTEANVRFAIGLASANLDTQLAAIPTDGLTAQQVWEYVTRTLTAGGGITAQEVWEYATREITGGTVDTLTNSPDVPTESEIAAQVRVELTPELTRVANCATVESTGDQLAGLL